MSSSGKNLAEVPSSAPKTPSIKSRVPQLSQTPRTGSKIPMNTQSRFSNKFTPKTPSLNTPTSRFLSTTNSARSISSPMNKSNNYLSKTPIHRPPTTPSSSRFASAKSGPNPTIKPQKIPLPKTPSTAKPSSNSRFTSNFHTPSRRPTLMDQKKMSRTVDCAKSIKRRSIKLLNQSASRLSFLNEMESGCVLMTPKLFQHLINNEKIQEEEEKLNEEDLKVRTIDPNNLLKYLLKEKTKTENESKSIKLEIVVNVNSPTQSTAQPLQLNFDTDKLETILNDRVDSQSKISSEKNETKVCDENVQVVKNDVSNQTDKKMEENEVQNLVEKECKELIQISEQTKSENKSESDDESDQNDNKIEENKVKIVENEVQKQEIQVPEQIQQEEAVPKQIQQISELNEKVESKLEDEIRDKSEHVETEKNESEVEIQEENKNPDFTIPFETIEEDDKNCLNQETLDDEKEENSDVLECKEISLQTDFNDSIKKDDNDDNKKEEIEEIQLRVENQVTDEMSQEKFDLESKKVEEIAETNKQDIDSKDKDVIEDNIKNNPSLNEDKVEIHLVKGKRGRKPKQNNEDNENNNAPVKGRRGRKAKDADCEPTKEEKRVSGQRVLTRAQRARLATKN